MRRALLLLLPLLALATAKPGIRAVDFRTFSYETESGKVDLRDGKGVLVADGEAYADVTELKVQYARLIPDQGEQALVLIGFRYRETPNKDFYRELQIFTMEEGAPKVVRHFVGGCCLDEDIQEVKVLHGRDLLIVRHTRGNRASGIDRTAYRWSNGDFKEVSSKFSNDN